jgi:hypothetical protein
MIVFSSVPVDPVRATSPFGPRNTGIAGASTYHNGIDLGANRTLSETPVMAVRRGVVSGNFWNDTRGWVITIDHVTDDGEKFRTLYQHLKQQSPHKVGAELEAGQVIGIMGASTKTIKGMAVHLHMELQVYKGNKWTPIDFMYQLTHVEEDMTETQVRQIVKEVLAESGDKASSWADAWPMAAKDGVTDGLKPQAYCTREQVVQLIYRAVGKVKRLNREASDGSD